MNRNSNRMVIASLCLGLALGITGKTGYDMIRKRPNEAHYVERHEGARRYINPLLGCDVAENVVNNPELVNFKQRLEKKLEASVAKNAKTSVYFRELNDGIWFSIGETEKFIPASLRKVPLMMALIKQAEKDQKLLDKVVTFDLANDYNSSQNFKPSKTLKPGGKYSIRDLIFRMIAYSDNNAFFTLTKTVDPKELERVYAVVRLENPEHGTNDDFFSVFTYMAFFRVLYNSSYLTREGSDWALDILAQSEFRTGIVGGVPQGVVVSHKFGEKSDPQNNQYQLHDCGIVYYPRHPYLLCIMSKGPDFQILDDIILETSKMVFTEVDNQHQKH